MENPNFMFGNIDEAIEHFQRNDTSQEQDTVLSGFSFLIRCVALEPDKYRGLEMCVTEQLNGNTYFNLRVNR